MPPVAAEWDSLGYRLFVGVFLSIIHAVVFVVGMVGYGRYLGSAR